MLGNFIYCNPTRLYFGEDSLSNLSTELKKFGQNRWTMAYQGYGAVFFIKKAVEIQYLSEQKCHIESPLLFLVLYKQSHLILFHSEKL